jgi:hypothetical protein
VSELEKREGTLACPRCTAAMKDVVRIAPVQNDRLCFGHEGTLGFHQARTTYGGPLDPEATKWMLGRYPADIRAGLWPRAGRLRVAMWSCRLARVGLFVAGGAMAAIVGLYLLWADFVAPLFAHR